jgi:hypothetical protein
MPIAILALATLGSPATARDLGAPLPPLAVQASATDAGTLVTWLPPADDGAGPLLGYHVYRHAGPTGGLVEVGSTDASTRSFVDSAAGDGVFLYSVTAENARGPSVQSAPAAVGALCDPLILAGTPPQAGVNWACIGPHPEILFVR